MMLQKLFLHRLNHFFYINSLPIFSTCSYLMFLADFAIFTTCTKVTHVILWNLNLYQYISALLNLSFLFRRSCLSSSGRQYAFRTIQSFRKRISQWNIFLGSLLWLQVWFSMKPTQTKNLFVKSYCSGMFLSSYILRRPQKCAKSSPYFCPM